MMSIGELREELKDIHQKLMEHSGECFRLAEEADDGIALMERAMTETGTPALREAAIALIEDASCLRDAGKHFMEDARMIREILESDDSAVWAWKVAMDTTRPEFFSA